MNTLPWYGREVGLIPSTGSTHSRKRSILATSRNKQKQTVIKNEAIKDAYVSLVTPDGVEVTRTEEAIRIAKARKHDLVVVSDKGKYPTAKIMDYGKHKFEKDKRQKEQRKKQQSVKVKEIKLRPKIHEHDIQVKLNQGIKFLSKGHKLKVTITFGKRDHRELGWDLINDLMKSLTPEHGVVESKPNMDGNALSMIVSPS